MCAAITNAEGEETRMGRAGRTMRDKTPLSYLTNPTQQQLSRYTKSELQKHCDQLGIGGIWTIKDKLIDKLIIYYRGNEDAQITPDENHERENERENTSTAELFDRFQNFVRETKDNFLVVNNSLVVCYQCKIIFL